MDQRFTSVAALAARQCSVVSTGQLDHLGIDASLRSKWVRRHLLERLGPRSFAIAGSPPTWERSVHAAYFDADGAGLIAGRTGARLMRLDDFGPGEPELLLPRELRHRAVNGVVRSTRRPIPAGDVQRVGALRVLRAERLILEAPLFDFGRAEVENAIDSAIRLRLVSEQRLRTRVVAAHSQAVNGGRLLLDALVDTGGESRLERWLLRLCREAGLPRPITQRVFREGTTVVARVDACFPGGLVVEAAGHGTHATRRQRQADEERRTLLTLRGLRVITFTYEDVAHRPAWVAAQIAAALRLAA